jgi:probable lipoprotein NlpC
MSATWFEKYIGIVYADKQSSFVGCDCWGLVALAHAHELGKEIPLYHDDYATTDETREIDAAINREKDNPLWQHARDLKPLDVLVFKMGRMESHVGLLINSQKMLHMSGTDCAKVEDFTSPKWASRLIGRYRWRGA